MPQVTVNIQGRGRLAKNLQTKIKKLHNATVVVGYSAPYALYVHESIEMELEGEPRTSHIGVYWGQPTRLGGQAQFLLKPFIEHKKDISNIVKNELRAGKTLRQALLTAGRILLKESKKLVPIETSKLRSSGFVHIEDSGVLLP